MLKLEFERAETPAEAGLREWAEAQASGPEFARIHGALHGVIATSMEEADYERSALRLLRIQAPDEIHALAVQAVRELQALASGSEESEENPLVTLPQMTSGAVFTEWLAGLGAVALSKAQPFQAVMSARAELAQEERKVRRGGRMETEAEALRETTQDVVFLMCMTPDEYLPGEFPPEARARFAELRGGYLNDFEWRPVNRKIAILDVLNSVNSAWTLDRMLSRMQVRSLLDGDDWEDDEQLQPIRREGRKIRPNEPCPCGSGKKYKKCHGAPGAALLP